ncbi:hypothetical protein D9M68_650020 [compost metagenome]
MGKVFDRLGQKEFVQAFERVVCGATSHSGEIVDLFAHAANAARLLDDTGLFHAAQEVHPLHWHDADERAFTEHGENVLFQGSDSSNSSPFCPGLGFGAIPLARQTFEGVVRGF